MAETSTTMNEDDVITGYNPLTSQQELAVFIVGVCSVALSLFGSGMIIFLLIRTKKWKTELQHRLVAGLTIMDIIVTLSIGLVPFAVPQETGKRFARGSFTTCEWAGFFFHFYLGGAYYNVALSLYYCLMVTYGWNANVIQKRMEPWVHIICFGTPLAINLQRLLTDMFNPDPINGVCTMKPYPADCLLSDDVECQRGTSAILPIVSILYLFPVAMGIYFTIRVFVSVRRKTRATLQYSVDGQLDPSQKRRIRAVGKQAVLYTAAFLNGFLVVMLNNVMEGVFFSNIETTEELKDEPGLFPTVFILYLLFPIQGFLNFLVYIRPRSIRWRQANQGRSRLWAFRMVLTGQQPRTLQPISKSAQVLPTGHSSTTEQGRHIAADNHDSQAATRSETIDETKATAKPCSEDMESIKGNTNEIEEGVDETLDGRIGGQSLVQDGKEGSTQRGDGKRNKEEDLINKEEDLIDETTGTM